MMHVAMMVSVMWVLGCRVLRLGLCNFRFDLGCRFGSLGSSRCFGSSKPGLLTPPATTPPATPVPVAATTPPATPVPRVAATTPPATPVPVAATTPPATPVRVATATTPPATPVRTAAATTPPATPTPVRVAATTPPATPTGCRLESATCRDVKARTIIRGGVECVAATARNFNPGCELGDEIVPERIVE